jgi:hypothetical protein
MTSYLTLVSCSNRYWSVVARPQLHPKYPQVPRRNLRLTPFGMPICQTQLISVLPNRDSKRESKYVVPPMACSSFLTPSTDSIARGRSSFLDSRPIKETLWTECRLSSHLLGKQHQFCSQLERNGISWQTKAITKGLPGTTLLQIRRNCRSSY